LGREFIIGPVEGWPTKNHFFQGLRDPAFRSWSISRTVF
jgi:hypothetical protein